MSDPADSLGQMIKELRLERIAPFLQNITMPGLGLQTRPVELGELAIGSSRIGGRPDLPRGHAWPERNGVPMVFIAQIDLGSIPPNETVHLLLPKDGLLQFFYDREHPWGLSPTDRGSSAVLHWPRGSDLEHERPPPECPSERVHPAEHAPCAVTLLPRGSIPAPCSIWFNAAALTKKERAGYQTLYNQFVAKLPTPVHQLLGHPVLIEDSDVAFDSYMVFHGLDMGGNGPWELRKAGSVIGSSGIWGHLLQIDTDDNAGMMWGDCGRLYFCAEGKSFGDRSFKNTWAMVQSS